MLDPIQSLSMKDMPSKLRYPHHLLQYNYLQSLECIDGPTKVWVGYGSL